MIKNCAICGEVFESIKGAKFCPKKTCKKAGAAAWMRARRAADPERAKALKAKNRRENLEKYRRADRQKAARLRRENPEKFKERERLASRTRWTDPTKRERGQAASRASHAKLKQARRNLEIAKLICSVGGLST